jgi:hypothetical protein
MKLEVHENKRKLAGFRAILQRGRVQDAAPTLNFCRGLREAMVVSSTPTSRSGECRCACQVQRKSIEK